MIDYAYCVIKRDSIAPASGLTLSVMVLSFCFENRCVKRMENITPLMMTSSTQNTHHDRNKNIEDGSFPLSETIAGAWGWQPSHNR